MRVLITGASGQVGFALAQELRCLANLYLYLASRQDIDLSKPDVICQRMNEIHPDLIINAAAYTAVDKAETEPKLAYLVNAIAVEALGRWAFQKKVPMIHFSTDYVFDGTAQQPYRETDPINPISVYGQSKAEGEKRLFDTGACCLVIRTAWVYSSTGKNFLKTIVRLATDKTELAVVSDQIGTPTSAHQIAQFVREVITGGLASLPMLFEATSHLINFTGSGWTSWHGFAEAIVTGMRHHGLPIKVSNVRAISSSEYPTAARRPNFSRLSTERLEQAFRYHPEPWDRALDDVLRSMFGNNFLSRS